MGGQLLNGEQHSKGMYTDSKGHWQDEWTDDQKVSQVLLCRPPSPMPSQEVVKPTRSAQEVVRIGVLGWKREMHQNACILRLIPPLMLMNYIKLSLKWTEL